MRRGLLALSLSTSMVLTGCSSQDELSARPFGESESLYEAPENIEEFIEIAQSTTLQLFCESEDEGTWGGGSGFHLEIGDDRFIITNAHVIRHCRDENADVFVLDTEDNLHVVELVSYRHIRDWRGEYDVAVLTGRDFGRALSIAQDDPKLGHWSMSVGWPSMNGHSYQQIAPGQILGLSPDGVIVSDGVTAPGMSGGPLLNSRGELIGLHYARSWDNTRRALSQTVVNLCEVAFVCGGDGKPTLPLEFPKHPIKTYLEMRE